MNQELETIKKALAVAIDVLIEIVDDMDTNGTFNVNKDDHGQPLYQMKRKLSLLP